MEELESKFIQCPYCWEKIEIEVDRSALEQEYVEDCHVCCQPILLQVTVSETRNTVVLARKENE